MEFRKPSFKTQIIQALNPAMLCIILLFCSVPALTSAERVARLDTIRLHLTPTIDSIIKLSTDTTKNIEGRSLTRVALATLFLGKPEDKAEKLVRLLFNRQYSDTLSPLYGWVPWSYQDTFVIDKNAIEFGMQAIGPLLLLYGSHLSSLFIQYLRPIYMLRSRP